MLELNRESDDALYNQLVTYFRARILEGELPPGSRLPTENELADYHRVSRGTVRQAMVMLVNDGLLERVQGRGTFVRMVTTAAQTPAHYDRIGLLLCRPDSELDLDILIGVENMAKRHGFQVSIAFSEERAEHLTQDIERLRADGVAGLIIYPLTNTVHDEAIWGLKRDRIPFVLIDRYFPDLECDYVVSDNFGGAYRATEHLIILGHLRIAFSHTAFGTPVTSSVRHRLQGYQQALENYGLPYDDSLVVVCDTRGDHNPYLELLARPNRPTAFFTTIPELIHPIMAAANNLGLHIPDDLALVSFDDLQFAPYLNPPLTTIAQSCQAMGEQAASLLIRRIRGQRGPADHINIPTKLMVRESCGAKVRVRAQISASI